MQGAGLLLEKQLWPGCWQGSLKTKRALASSSQPSLLAGAFEKKQGWRPRTEEQEHSPEHPPEHPPPAAVLPGVGIPRQGPVIESWAQPASCQGVMLPPRRHLSCRTRMESFWVAEPIEKPPR